MPALRRDEETRCCSLNLWISRECGCVFSFARVPLFVVLRGNKWKTTVLRGPEKNDTIMSGYTDQRLQTEEKGCQVVEANGDERWLMWEARLNMVRFVFWGYLLGVSSKGYQRQPIVRRLPPLETNPQLIAKHCSLWSNVLHSRCETCEKVPLTSQPSPIIYRVRSWLLSDFV